jgi:hypothetical protein
MADEQEHVEEELQGLVNPIRTSYTHKSCGAKTELGSIIATTLARQPTFFTNIYCSQCGERFPTSEFEWEDGSGVGT